MVSPGMRPLVGLPKKSKAALASSLARWCCLLGGGNTSRGHVAPNLHRPRQETVVEAQKPRRHLATRNQDPGEEPGVGPQ